MDDAENIPANPATSLSFDSLNLARLTHNNELTLRYVQDLNRNLINHRGFNQANNNNETNPNSNCTKESMRIFGSIFKKLMVKEFGEEMIFEKPLEFFVQNFPEIIYDLRGN